MYWICTEGLVRKIYKSQTILKDSADVILLRPLDFEKNVLKLLKKAVLKNFTIFTGKHLCWSLFLIKLPAFRFSCEYCEIFKKTYLEKHLWTAASENNHSNIIPRSLVILVKQSTSFQQRALVQIWSLGLARDTN